jgi:hypothetical protein
VHFLQFVHEAVRKAVIFQGASDYTNYKLFNINDLILCLKNVQILEAGEKQGEIGVIKILSAKLSTEKVDRFSLATLS